MTENKLDMCEAIKTVAGILGGLSPDYVNNPIEHAELLRKVHDKQKEKSVLVEKETLRDAVMAINEAGYNFKNLETAALFLFDFFSLSADNEDGRINILNSFEENEKTYRIVLDYVVVLQKAMTKVCGLFTNIVVDVGLEVEEEAEQINNEPLTEEELAE